MCLAHVDSKWKGLSRKVETGYKIFVYFPPTNQLKFTVFSHNGQINVETNKWLTSGLSLVGDCNKKYRAGFHIYKNMPTIPPTAINYRSNKIVKVKYKGVLAKGRQVDQEVIVAHRMWVPRQKK